MDFEFFKLRSRTTRREENFSRFSLHETLLARQVGILPYESFPAIPETEKASRRYREIFFSQNVEEIDRFEERGCIKKKKKIESMKIVFHSLHYSSSVASLFYLLISFSKFSFIYYFSLFHLFLSYSILSLSLPLSQLSS